MLKWSLFAPLKTTLKIPGAPEFLAKDLQPIAGPAWSLFPKSTLLRQPLLLAGVPVPKECSWSLDVQIGKSHVCTKSHKMGGGQRRGIQLGLVSSLHLILVKNSEEPKNS